jgi:phosphate transport system substrate-binding protein
MLSICKCPNIGNCEKADKKELLTIPDGADLICPECGADLVVTQAKPGSGGVGKIAAAIAAVLVLGLVYLLWPKPAQPPDQDEKGLIVQPPPPSQARNVILSIHGSNTIGSRLVPELAKAFLERKGASRIEQVPGGKERESFIQGDLNGDTVPEAIEIHAHGSKTAFADLKDGRCDIGMSSSKVKEETVRELLPLVGDLTSNASEHIVALDGLAVIVHPANPVSALTVEQVAAIFTGEVTDWSQVRGAPAPIALYPRDDKSGTGVSPSWGRAPYLGRSYRIVG